MKPIAVIGVGCRFPGAEGSDALWTIARDGLCRTTETPPDRWSVDGRLVPVYADHIHRTGCFPKPE